MDNDSVTIDLLQPHEGPSETWTGGDTLLRYDNAPYHLDVGRYHRHPPEGDITTLAFTGLSGLIEEFQNEVTEIHEQRTD